MRKCVYQHLILLWALVDYLLNWVASDNLTISQYNFCLRITRCGLLISFKNEINNNVTIRSAIISHMSNTTLLYHNILTQQNKCSPLMQNLITKDSITQQCNVCAQMGDFCMHLQVISRVTLGEKTSVYSAQSRNPSSVISTTTCGSQLTLMLTP